MQRLPKAKIAPVYSLKVALDVPPRAAGTSLPGLTFERYPHQQQYQPFEIEDHGCA